MSLINPKGGWIRFDGTPLPGITPPQVRLRSGTLTPERLAAVSDIYSKFTTARRLSVAGSGYFTADRKLPDGTIVRMVSINDVDHVHIWAADTATEETLDVTFWCQPWDDAWIDEQFAEVFIIPRWLEIGPGEDEVLKEDFLKDLVRSTVYEPPMTSGYPGNQTWFSQEFPGVVVSWWGPPKRYAMSERDWSVAQGTTWFRTRWPESETVSFAGLSDSEIEDILRAPTGGVSGAVAGHMFDMVGATELPPDVDPLGRQPVSASVVWINGAAVQAQGTVNSACLQRRGDDIFLRTLHLEFMLVRVREIKVNTPGALWELVGSASIAPSTIGLGAAVSYTSGFPWAGNYFHASQPFHWNEAGDKAVSVVHYITADKTDRLEKYGTHAVIEVSANQSVSTALIDQTYETSTYSNERITITPPPGVWAGGDYDTVTDSVSSYYCPIAADYKGGDISILKTHVSSVGHGLRHETSVNDWHYGSYGDPYLYAKESSVSGEYSLSFESWASVGGTEILGTRHVREYVSSETGLMLLNNIDNTSGPFVISSAYDQSWSADGDLGLWGLVSGDIRSGVLLLCSTPFNTVPDSPPWCVDSQSNYEATRSYLADGDGSQALVVIHDTLDVSVTDNSDAGEIRVAKPDNTSTLLTNLCVPTMRENVGTLHAEAGQPIDRYGQYGSGPFISLGATGSVCPPIGDHGAGLLYGVLSPRRYAIYTNGGGESRITVGVNDSILWSPTKGDYISESHDVVGGYGRSALSASAITPDKKIQYVGAVMTAMTPPNDKMNAICFSVDKWFNEGNEFTPLYPDQPDPENPGGTMPFPHRGDHAILLDPIFTGPMP